VRGDDRRPQRASRKRSGDDGVDGRQIKLAGLSSPVAAIHDSALQPSLQ
jgi:hypothetical protein